MRPGTQRSTLGSGRRDKDAEKPKYRHPQSHDPKHSLPPLTHGGWTRSVAGPCPAPQQVYSGHKIDVPDLSPGPPRLGPDLQGALWRVQRGCVWGGVNSCKPQASQHFTVCNSPSLPPPTSPCLSSPLLLTSHHWARSKAAFTPEMQEYRSILAGPMLVIYPVPLRGGMGKKEWNCESSDLLFIPCSFWSLSLMDLFNLTLTCLFTCSFLSCWSPHLECNIYKGRYFCQLFHSDNSRVKNSG